jgi:hypothetical protein
MNQTNTGTSTIGLLLSDLRSETTTLLRQEIDLAKAELAEKANVAARTSMGIAQGGAVAYAGLIVLLIGVGQLLSVGLAALGLQEAVAAWLGPILVGGIAGAVGLVLLAKAKHTFQAENFDLPHTVASLKEDKRWVQSKIQHAQQ